MPATEAVISLDHAWDEAAFLNAARGGLYPQFGVTGPDETALSFLRQIRDDAVAEDVAGLSLADMLQLAADFWDFAQVRGPETAQIRIRPATGENGRALERDVLEIVGPDRPFLVDSVMSEIASHGLDVLAMFHPIVPAARDAARARADGGAPGVESMIQVHLAPLRAEQRAALENAVRETLEDVRLAVEDWKPMLAEMESAIEELSAARNTTTGGPGAEETAEALEFLHWLRDDHFAFLGSRAYSIPVRSQDAAVAMPRNETGLGLLRHANRAVLRDESEPVLTQSFLTEPTPVVVAKSNMRSRVHRRTVADYVSVKRYSAEGEVIGERRFVGLFTAEAYHRMAREVPLIRRKVQYVIDHAAKLPDGHSAKKLRNILETYPRDELFQISKENLLKITLGVLHLEDRPRPGLFLRRDRFDRFVSALVYLPRERYSSDLRAQIGEMLRDAYRGRLSAFYPHFADGPLARVQIIIGLEPGVRADPDPAALERQIVRLARNWEDEFEQHLRASDADDAVRAAAARYVSAFGAGYREAFGAPEALADIRKMESLGAAPDIEVMAFVPANGPPPAEGRAVLRFKIYHRAAPLPLSRVMPILETLGLEVIWEQGHRVACGEDHLTDDDPDCVWIHDFEMRLPKDIDPGDAAMRARFEEAFAAVWRGYSEADRFNSLIFTAGAGWRDAAFLRTVARYRYQTDVETTHAMQEDALQDYPQIARLLLAMRDAKFDPDAPLDMDVRRAKCAEIEAEILKALDGVQSLDFDRVLRRIFRVMQAALRTNFFQRAEDGGPKNYIAIKIASRDIEDLPEPKPYREIFVWAPHVEGVHLRFGPVARGGLRWSDRRDDFRTEVLGLVKAQQVKNAVIVPVGAKGGFFPKRLPKGGTRDAVQAAAVEAYKTFIRALLDITDNLAGGAPLHPERVVMWDGDDPYLVVAADKGTATFSDIANGVAAEYGFWLGDAFASGGSAGYDHKAMGITARGAWEAVKRHFRELGKDIQTTPFTVIGVGDMSGDVFGNAMMLSAQIKLIAAFDHRDIFIDPDPDPAASHEERTRLFGLPRSSWKDYDPALISAGGGVFSRSEKSIPLTPQMRAVSGLAADSATPAQLIHALLGAECELLFFGGIGAYVKASDEQHSEAGDKANDALRVNGKEVRALVIGEGANLGVTQRGRIEYARHGGPKNAGGRINTDAVDNSAGVDTSDHEVNIKILLNGAMESGRLEPDERNALLSSMTDEVARHVLRHNYDQTLAITLSEDRAADDLDAHERLMLRLERAGRLNRGVEELPTTEQIAALREAKKGLTRPEIAVLIAYAKIWLFDELVDSTVPDDPHFTQMLCDYFPPQLARFDAEMQGHRLHREIIATTLANHMIDLGGPTFVNRAREMTGAATAEIARAFESARRIFRYDELTARINALDNAAPASAQTTLHRETLRLLRRQTQWLARRGRGQEAQTPPRVDETVAAYQAGVDALKTILPEIVSGFQQKQMEMRVADFTAAGAPEHLARDAAALLPLTAAPDIIDLAEQTGWSLTATAYLYHRLGERFLLDEVRAAADEHVSQLHWTRVAARRIIEALYSAQLRLAESAIDFAKAQSLGEKGGEHLKGEAAPSGAWADGLLEAWIAANAFEAGRADAAIAELTASGGWTLAKVAIAETLYREFAELALP